MVLKFSIFQFIHRQDKLKEQFLLQFYEQYCEGVYPEPITYDPKNINSRLKRTFNILIFKHFSAV